MGDSDTDMFPILPSARYGYVREYVPEWIVKKHEAQAMKNHGDQTVERLAQRGGLSWYELYCTLNGIGLLDIRDKEMRQNEDHWRMKCMEMIGGCEYDHQ